MTDSYVKDLIKVIDELYLFQAGPFGSIICDDALENWKSRHRLLHPMHLPGYIDELLAELPDAKLQQAFLESLRDHDDIYTNIALKVYIDKKM